MDFDLENINIEDIYKKQLKFEYKPKEDNYKNILYNSPSVYKKELETFIKVQPIKTYFDLEKLQWLNENTEPFEVDLIRAKYLKKKKLIKILNETIDNNFSI